MNAHAAANDDALYLPQLNIFFLLALNLPRRKKLVGHTPFKKYLFLCVDINLDFFYRPAITFTAAWKIIRGWLPPKFVDRVKFVDKKTLKDWIDADNQLVDWGGNDNYTYKFEPEVRQKRPMPNGRSAPDAKPRKVSTNFYSFPCTKLLVCYWIKVIRKLCGKKFENQENNGSI